MKSLTGDRGREACHLKRRDQYIALANGRGQHHQAKVRQSELFSTLVQDYIRRVSCGSSIPVEVCRPKRLLLRCGQCRYGPVVVEVGVAAQANAR